MTTTAGNGGDSPGSVLMITYTFAPSPWVGVYRNLKYCKYLGRFGWTPIVLTARISKDSFTDPRLMDQVPPDVSIHRSWDFDPAKIEAKLAEKKLRRLQAASASSESSHPIETLASPSEQPAPRFFKAKKFIKEVLKESPDPHLFWVPFAVITGFWVLLRKRVDVIYCSSPPHSSHLIAYVLATLFRKPYVLDFRDPWYTEGSVRPPKGRMPFLVRIEAGIKRRIVRQAAHTICVSQGEREEMLREFPFLPPSRVSVITNGFDTDDAPASTPPPPPPRPMRFLHAGTIYPGVADELFSAVERLAAENPSLHTQVQFDFIGDVAVEYLPVLHRLTARRVVRHLGTVSHSKAMSMMAGSDVLLILMGGNKYEASHIPSKTFEYLQIGKPVLAVAKRGEMSDILEKSGIGTIVDPGAIDDLALRIRQIHTSWLDGRLGAAIATEYIARFERATLASRLAAVLAEVRPSARTGSGTRA